jgi:hypothetical protein
MTDCSDTRRERSQREGVGASQRERKTAAILAGLVSFASRISEIQTSTMSAHKFKVGETVLVKAARNLNIPAGAYLSLRRCRSELGRDTIRER